MNDQENAPIDAETNEITPKKYITEQTFTTLYITKDWNIFIGTKFWLLIYGYNEELFLQKSIMIGSKVTCIDSFSKENNEERYVVVSTGDGFINVIEINNDNNKPVKIEKIPLYFREAKFVSIIETDTFVSVGDESVISISRFEDNQWKLKKYRRKEVITALKYFDNKIFIGYQNGVVDILTNKGKDGMQFLKSNLKYDCSILDFYFYSKSIFVVTDKSCHELFDLKEKNVISFPENFNAKKVSIIFNDDNNQLTTLMLIANSDQAIIYKNDQECKIYNNLIESGDINSSSWSFFGDSIIIISSKTIYLYE